jgi:hypothetical protein
VRPWPPESQAQGDARAEDESWASVVIRGHALVQDLRRGHYELAFDATRVFRLATAFDELGPAI